MSVLDAILIFVAGMAAGTINTIVGSGSLITFPTLLMLGYPAVPANISNNLGMVAGGISGSWGYRRELSGSSATLRRMTPLSFVGAVVGALLLLVLPAAAFKAIVPVLILIALVLVVAGPWLQRRALANHHDGAAPAWHTWAMGVGVFVSGVYGGFFGAAQGVLLIGILSVLSTEPIQRLNAYKNILALVVNGTAAIVFVIVAWSSVMWPVVLFVAAGAFCGGFIGARVGRRLPPAVLRGVIITIGIVAIVKLVWFS